MSESNNNIPMRITQLEEATSYPEGAYLPIAKAGYGTKKILTDLPSNSLLALDNGIIKTVSVWKHGSLSVDGEETANANRIISDFIEINQTYTDWKVKVVSGYSYMVQYYDGSNNKVGGFWWIENDFYLSEHYSGSYKYIRIAIKETTTDSLVNFTVGENTIVSATSNIQSQINNNNFDISIINGELKYINDYLNSKQLVSSFAQFDIKGRPYKSDGTTMIAANWDRTDLIDISSYSHLSYVASAFNASNIILQVLTFFDENGDYLSGLNTASSTSGVTVKGDIDIPVGAKYVSVLANQNITPNPSLIGHFSNIKIMCLGDSLTAGTYASDSQIHEKGYPYFLQKYMGGKYNIIKKGFVGQSAKTIWNSSSMMNEIGDVSGISEMIICLGTNGGYGSMETIQTAIHDYVEPYTDYNDFDKTNTIACYCAMIEKFYDDNPDINIILCIPPYASNIAPSGIEKNYTLLKTAIDNISDRYRLSVIDINHLMGVNAINTAHYQADGVHGNEQFYSRLGTLIGSQLNSYSSFVY